MSTSYRTGMSWSARLLVGLVLILVGAGAATWGLARSQRAASFLGIAPARSTAAPAQRIAAAPSAQALQDTILPEPERDDRVAQLEGRLSQVENAAQRTESFAGRADALVVAFAARRAIDRGVALGYLENLLVDRFGSRHQRAVATIITASHRPVQLDDLIAEY